MLTQRRLEQVPRTSESAAAFAQGLFPCEHVMGSSQGEAKARGTQEGAGVPGSTRRHLLQAPPEATCPAACLPPPVALSMSPADNDTRLRFFDACPAYKEFKRRAKADIVRCSFPICAHLLVWVHVRVRARACVYVCASVNLAWRVRACT